MPKVTIVGNSETGVCNLGLPDCPHSRTGTNSSGSPTVFVNNKPVHRQGDSGSCNCPHGGVYTSTNGSSSVFVENKPITRIGDTTTCDNCGQSGSHSTGSNNVFAGG